MTDPTAAPKGKIGRPRTWPDEFLEQISSQYPWVKTRRGKINLCYQHWAMLVLSQDEHPERYHWLADFKAAEAGDNNATIRPSVLTELGRFMDPDDICGVAQFLCEEVDPKPTTKEAVRQLQRVRADWENDTAFIHLLSSEQWTDIIRKRGLEWMVLEQEYKQKVADLRQLLAEVKAMEATRSFIGQSIPTDERPQTE